MSARQITEAAAREILTDEAAEFAPFRVLNAAGQAEVTDWLRTVAKTEQTDAAWFADAEDAANNAAEGEAIIIEMRGASTLSGRPETLTVDPAGFDWWINQ